LGVVLPDTQQVQYVAPLSAATPAPTTTTTAPAAATTTTAPPAAPTTTTTAPPAPVASSSNEASGGATYYASSFPSSGCASPTLAPGTVLTVTAASGGQVVCTVDDREADNPGRVVDLSPAEFSELAPLSQGVIEVTVTW